MKPRHMTLLVILMGMAGAVFAAKSNTARAAIEKVFFKAAIGNMKPSVIDGYQEVMIDNQFFYVRDDGKYLIKGDVIDLTSRKSVTESSKAKLYGDMLAQFSTEKRIVFPADKMKYRVTVFTDISCGFCQKLHTQMTEYNRAGITVEYVFFPREGLASQSSANAVSAWCASDRRKAVTNAMAGKPIVKKTCVNPVAESYAFGHRMGVADTGTPSIFLQDGTLIGGYVSPTDMLAILNKRNKGNAYN